MTDKSLLIEVDQRGVASATINRPEVLNAFDEDLIGRISSAFESLDTDHAVRIVVLRATGRVFCAGADIGWMQRAASNAFDDNLDDARRFAMMMSADAATGLATAGLISSPSGAKGRWTWSRGPHVRA